MRFLLTQWMLILLCIGWMMLDPLASETLLAFPAALASWQLSELGAQLGPARLGLVWSMVIVGLASVAAEIWFAYLVTKTKLTIRRLLCHTLVVAAWFGFAGTFQHWVWRGKTRRSTHRIAELDRVAALLRADWPSDSGDIDGLGPYTAYPFDEPSLLLLLTPFPLESTNTVVAAIERSVNGSLRFELGGDDGGDWLEWHPSGERPNNFTGGLSDPHHLVQATQLDEQWFLVRYSDRGR
ncbi:MAG: hypothetical protein AAF670_00630 [Planctomycetota bacterium]